MIKLFENAPVSELQKRLSGEPQKRYAHLGWCSGDRRKPIGTKGVSCCCSLVNKDGTPFVMEHEIAGRVK